MDLHRRWDNKTHDPTPQITYMTHMNFSRADINRVRATKENFLSNADFTATELDKALATLNPNKATGLDKIAPTFLNEIAKNPAAKHNLLLPYLNKVFSSRNCPSQWKIDRRVPIEKKGDKTNSMNYRPIAIHSVFRKLYCTLLERRMRVGVSGVHKIATKPYRSVIRWVVIRCQHVQSAVTIEISRLHGLD